MIITAILHKSDEGFNTFEKKLEKSLDTNPSIVIGPYGSLTYENKNQITSLPQKNEIYKQIKELSSSSNSLIIPGTILSPINNQEVACEAPIFYKGNLISNLYKEKDNGEEDLANKEGYSYKRGNNSKNIFYFDGKKIAIELCGDHGTQNVYGCDLELILSYDQKAGFWINASNDNFSRYAIVCDGFAPKIEGFHFDSNKSFNKIGVLNKKILNNYLGVFELDERNVHYL